MSGAESEEAEPNSVSLQDADLTQDEKEELWENRGGHRIQPDADVDYELAGNVVYDLVKYIRSNTIRNEQQFILVLLGYLTGFFGNIDHYVSGVLIGTSSSGKTHVQNKVEDLFHEDHLYQATTGSDKALIYDGDWDKCYTASLDELQKPSKTMIEFLKSVHGDDESFNYKLTPDSAEEREDENIKTITRLAKPYWFLYAQFDSDFEMWNRLLKVPVHESESKNRAVGAMSADHFNIRIGDEEETYNYEFREGSRALKSYIASIPGKIKNGNIPDEVILPNGQGPFDWDVWNIVEPIYNHKRSESNRVYDMVHNLIRASALLNHANRETIELKVPGREKREYLVAEPQDVANVLSCRRALLATTHELDERKWEICMALKRNTGGNNEGQMSDILNGLEQSDASLMSRNQLRANLEKLHENYLVEIHKGAGDDGSDTYQFYGWDELGFARIEENPEVFNGNLGYDVCFDPVDGQNFIESHKDLKAELQETGRDLTAGADTQIKTGQTGQRDLTGGVVGDTGVDLEPYEMAVLDYVKASLDGERIRDLRDVSVEELYGIDPANKDGSLLDPEHDVWNQPDRPDDWVESEKDARRMLKQAILSMIEERVVVHDEIFDRDSAGEPIDVRFAVLGRSDL